MSIWFDHIFVKRTESSIAFTSSLAIACIHLLRGEHASGGWAVHAGEVMMIAQSVMKLVQDRLLSVQGAPTDIDEATPLLEGGMLDSLALVDLLAALSETFALEFDEDDLDPDNFATVGALVQMVERKRAAARSAA